MNWLIKKIYRYELSKLGILLQLVLDFENLYNFFFIVLSVLSLYYPYLFGIMILDIVRNNDYLKSVFLGFFENFIVFVKTFQTGLIIIFWFSVIGYYYFNS